MRARYLLGSVNDGPAISGSTMLRIVSTTAPSAEGLAKDEAWCWAAHRLRIPEETLRSWDRRWRHYAA